MHSRLGLAKPPAGRIDLSVGSLRPRSERRALQDRLNPAPAAPQEVTEAFGQGGRVTPAHAGPDPASVSCGLQ